MLQQRERNNRIECTFVTEVLNRIRVMIKIYTLLRAMYFYALTPTKIRRRNFIISVLRC